MPFLIVVALVTFLSCAAAGLNPDAVRAMTAVGHGAAALAAIVLPRTRNAAFETLKRLHRGAWAYAAVLLLGAVMTGAIVVGASPEPHDAEQAMVSLAGFGFFFVAVTAVAVSVGRNRAISALLWVPLALAVLTIFDRLDGRGDFFGFLAGKTDPGVTASFLTATDSASVFGLFAVLGVFALLDEWTRRTGPGGAPQPGLAQRLFLPVAALVSCVGLLALSGSTAGAASAAAGAAVLALVVWRRRRASRNSRKEPAYAAIAVSVIAAGLALQSGAATAAPGAAAEALRLWGAHAVFGAGLGIDDAPPSGDVLRWLAEAGLFGTGALLATLGFVLWFLWTADDHSRRPTRGFALGAGVMTCAALGGAFAPALASPSASGVYAALLGLAAAYVDPPAEALKVKQSARTRVL